MSHDPIVIVSAARTPMGAFQGGLSGFAAAELGAAAIRAAVERAKVKPEDVQEVIMGCVLPAGQGQALGSRVEELVEIRRRTEEVAGIPVGFCVDTAHAFAAGLLVFRHAT